MTLPPPPPAIHVPVAMPQPIRAIVSRTAVGFRVQLLARSAEQIRLDYKLVAGARGNVAIQSGATRLERGRDVVLLDLTQAADADWSGTLEVLIDGQLAYRIALHAPA